jgi:trimethylamine:corrinoid methyltransferase-like protein
MQDSIHIIPSINILSPEAIARIHESSLKILSEIGIRVDSAKAVRYFKSATGAKLLGEGRFVLQPEIVEWALKQCPSTIDHSQP